MAISSPIQEGSGLCGIYKPVRQYHDPAIYPTPARFSPVITQELQVFLFRPYTLVLRHLRKDNGSETQERTALMRFTKGQWFRELRKVQGSEIQEGTKRLRPKKGQWF